MSSELHDRDRALTAAGDDLIALLHHPATDVLLLLLDNPALDESKLCLLLERKNLPGEVIEEIARRKPLMKSYRIKRALALHPHTSRLIGLRLLRELYLMDLVQLTMSPGVSAELKRNAEEQILARLPQLPLGQKITLARRGPTRVAGGLLAEGHAQTLAVVLDNPNLTESQILKALAREKLAPQVSLSIAHHPKWSHTYNVRLALVRHPAAPLAAVLSFLPELTVSDLRELAAPGVVAENLRKYLESEIHRRMKANKRSAPGGEASGPASSSGVE